MKMYQFLRTIESELPRDCRMQGTEAGEREVFVVDPNGNDLHVLGIEDDLNAYVIRAGEL